MNKYYNEVKDTISEVVSKGFTVDRVDFSRGFGCYEGVDYIDASSGDLSKATDAVLLCDESHLMISTPKGDKTWIYFVLGNELGEAVNDWGIPFDADEANVLWEAISKVSDRYMEMED